MTESDEALIEEAGRIKYWEYPKVYPLIDKAETEECKRVLETIVSFLYDYYCYEI